mmetsp:Transcript_10717/g.39694  ORF Transcript_10717/g.39694 Transcript_10717/m.39694 type:complete len:104 (+) Transcript_10717:1770-2081(+)
MEKHTTCGSQVLKSGATETSNATGVVKNNADFSWTWNDHRKNPNPQFTKHHTNPSLLGFFIWCATAGAMAVTVQSNANRMAVSMLSQVFHLKKGFVKHHTFDT